MTTYRRDVDAFQRDTGDLSLLEVGAYDRLLDHYYATSAPLPDDLTVLNRVCRAISDQEQAAVRVVVHRFFPRFEADGLRHNPRADHEIKISLQAVEYGRKGGRPPADQKTSSQTSSETSNITSFLSFWDAYPRKVSRAAAVKVWRRLAPDAELQATMLAALDAQKRAPQWSDKQFIPHASTWLNGRRWEDEITGLTKPPKPSRSSVASANAEAAKAWIEEPGQERKRDDLDSLQTLGAAGARQGNGEWATTNEGIAAKGRELGMLAQGTETYEQWRDRILAELERRRLRDESKLRQSRPH